MLSHSSNNKILYLLAVFWAKFCSWVLEKRKSMRVAEFCNIFTLLERGRPVRSCYCLIIKCSNRIFIRYSDSEIVDFLSCLMAWTSFLHWWFCGSWLIMTGKLPFFKYNVILESMEVKAIFPDSWVFQAPKLLSLYCLLVSSRSVDSVETSFCLEKSVVWLNSASICFQLWKLSIDHRLDAIHLLETQIVCEGLLIYCCKCTSAALWKLDL